MDRAALVIGHVRPETLTPVRRRQMRIRVIHSFGWWSIP